MTWRIAIAAALGLGAAASAAAAGGLTAEGAHLRDAVAPLEAPFELSVPAPSSEVLSVHVTLNPASSNQVLARDRDGFWAPWGGDPSALPVSAARREGDRLVFKLFAEGPPPEITPPWRITLIARTAAGARIGWLDAAPEAAR